MIRIDLLRSDVEKRSQDRLIACETKLWCTMNIDSGDNCFYSIWSNIKIRFIHSRPKTDPRALK